MVKSLVILGLLALVEPTIYAATIHVPADSVTIQQAIDMSADGDTVLVDPGTYGEYLNFNGHNIVLGSLYLTTGDTSYISSTILDGWLNGKVVTFENGEDSTAVITGFTIMRGMAWFGHGGGIYCNGSSPTIRSNIIRDNVAFYYGGGIYCGNLSPRIIDNVIIGNRGSRGGGGIYCNFESGPTIANNNICMNQTDGNGGGIFCNEADPIITNNTVAGNGADSSGGGIYFHFCAPLIANSILWDNTAASGEQLHVDNPKPPVVIYCDIDGGWDGEGNLDTLPLFMAPADSNYDLCAQSPCIDAGDPGLTDPDGSRTDIGRWAPDRPACIIGKVIYVSVEGSDFSGDGSVANPYRTIQRGIDISFSGDTVLVESGIYSENINFNGHNIVLASRFLLTGDRSHIESAIIDGGALGPVVTFDHDEDSAAVITGFTIRNGLEETHALGGGIRCYESSPVINSNIITGNAGCGVCCEGSTYLRTRPNVVGNTITDNEGPKP
jgi:hypothetical protein